MNVPDPEKIFSDPGKKNKRILDPESGAATVAILHAVLI
jgi:hypothetical protein